MSSLTESSELIASLQFKCDEVNQLNGLFQLEIDEMKTEVIASKDDANVKKGEIEKLRCKVADEEAIKKGIVSFSFNTFATINLILRKELELFVVLHIISPPRYSCLSLLSSHPTIRPLTAVCNVVFTEI